jgi:hypothetical protein
MPQNGVVLIYGADHQLLETRRWLLERAGHTVTTCSSLEPEDLQEEVRVLIFCHTIVPVERLKLLETVRALRPELKIVTMSLERSGYGSATGEHFVGPFEGPERLLHTVRNVFSTEGTTAEG